MIDQMLALIADCVDQDVTYVPIDPDANDKFAANASEVGLSWTLGHVIVHTTASAEEAAFLAAELARGVPYRGARSRYEVPWQSVTTIAQCRARLEESRRMRLASLELWPLPPHLDNTYSTERFPEPINATVRFGFGLRHDDSHVEQIKKIVQQTKAARK
jgi:DinB superfamily